jgi:peptidoglycan/LPS O-acetylase OafA/YrhL
MENVPGRRLTFLDNLRLVVVLLVIVLHTGIAYMVGAPEWWYVVDPQQSLFFTAVVLVLDVPLMLIMFFIAGFFACPSLTERSVTVFVKGKILRLGLPWAAGIFIFAPLVTYLIYYSRNVPVSFGRFYTVDFWGPLYQQSVYWFLGVLLVLFLGLALVYHSDREKQNWERKVNRPGWGLFVGFWLIGSAWFYLIVQSYPLDMWSNGARILVFQPERALLYVLYFALGVYADRRGWLRNGGYAPARSWILPMVLSGVAYLALRLYVVPGSGVTGWIGVLTGLLFNGFCLSALMAGLAFFRKHADSDRRPWGSLSANSYGIYYLHPLVLYPLTYVFLSLPVSIFTKAGLLVITTILLAWAGSAWILKKAPVTRLIF